MIEALAAAVVAAIVAGTGDAVKVVATDTYSVLKGLLTRLAPTFDPDTVDSQAAEVKKNELADKLSSVSSKELEALAQATADLASAANAKNLADNLIEFSKVIKIESIEAKKHVSIRLQAHANETIKTQIKGIRTDADFSFVFNSKN